MKNIFSFGETIDGFDYKVINENEARASAGIMFLLGMLSLFSFILTKNIFWANIFTITFIIEFIVRVFINPKYAPYMLLGSVIVSNQKPYWVEAKPKKFAWILGFLLGAIMSYYILLDILSPFRLLVCLLCLFLLFLESAFGICLGCLIYKKLNYKLYNCPGGICNNEKRVSLKSKYIMLAIYVALFFGLFVVLKKIKNSNITTSALTKRQIKNEEIKTKNAKIINKECKPPQWAIDIGHKDMWIQHHCKQKDES
jgi:hypothetical protein